MRIAMIIPSLAHTGPGIVARDLCEEFVSLGHECEIFYFDDIFGLQTTCKTTRIKSGNELDPSEWDIIHSHGFRPDRFVSKHFKKDHHSTYKLITTLHQPISINELSKTYSLGKSVVGSILWYKSLKVHDNIVVLNEDTQNKLPNNLKEKTKVIFNGRTITINEIASEEKDILCKLKSRYKIIGTCSSITKRKGLEQIVKALPNLPDYAFVAVGDGDQKAKLECLSRTLNISDRCIFLGYRSNSTDYLPYFDIFMMCTRSEGFPLALVEAASQGIPTILSDIPILKSIVDENIVDFYHLDDMDSLVKSVQNCNLDKGKNLKTYYEEYLTAKSMAERYLILYCKSLSKRPTTD